MDMRVPSITEILSGKIKSIEARLPVPILRTDNAGPVPFATELQQSMQSATSTGNSVANMAQNAETPDEAALLGLRLSGLASQALAAASFGGTTAGGTADTESQGLAAYTGGTASWPRLDSTQLEAIQPRIHAAIEAGAAAAGLDPLLLKALVAHESNFQPFSLSSAGAMGLTQLMPGTAQDLGVSSPYDIEQNVAGGARYLRQQLNAFGGDLSLALAAYNAGPNAVRTHGGVPPYQETQAFIGKVLTTYNGYRAAEGIL